MTQMVQPTTAPKLPTTGDQAMPDMSGIMKYMSYFIAFMMGSFAYSVPSGVGLYLLATTAFGVGQFIIQYKELVKVEIQTHWQMLTGK